MITRRLALSGAVSMPFVLGLTACGGRTESQLQADVQTIAAGLSGILADLQAVPGLNMSAGTATQIAHEIAVIKSQAAEIAGALAPGQTVAADFAEAVTTLAALVQPFFPMAPAVAAVITAAASLAQVVLQETGALSAARSSKWTMPAGQARALLRAAK